MNLAAARSWFTRQDPGDRGVRNPCTPHSLRMHSEILMEFHPVIEQVAWSRGVEAHMALLPREPKRLEFEASSFRAGESGFNPDLLI